MAHFVPITQSVTAERIAFLLLPDVVRLHGVPAAIVSDGDTSSTGEARQYMCRKLSVQPKMSSARRLQTDGQAEHTNETIEQMLRCAILGNDTKLSDFLPLLSLRTTDRHKRLHPSLLLSLAMGLRRQNRCAAS